MQGTRHLAIMVIKNPPLVPVVVEVVVVVERERERERDACDVIDMMLKSRVIMDMITWTARRPYASTRSEPVVGVELSARSSCKDKELGA